MLESNAVRPEPTSGPHGIVVIDQVDIENSLDRLGYGEEVKRIVFEENLLPPSLLTRLHNTYPEHSALLVRGEVLFKGRKVYEGLEGFREVVGLLADMGVVLDALPERELFIEVYRFKTTRHILNSIDWSDPVHDSLYQLVFPQPGMMPKDLVAEYEAASTPEERTRIARSYLRRTNPHDAHQLLNKPWIERDDGEIDILEGSQHKYPQCQLIFDRTTQECFAFCTYCFRHAQVRGDEDMFIQEDIDQIHEYLRLHREVTDILVTGGDAGYIPPDRLWRYVEPILRDPDLWHVRTVRLGSRMLTYEPERALTKSFERYLDIFRQLTEHGVHVSWMAHFSTPREILNPATLAAVRRIARSGATIRSQSPIMRHISMFETEDGRIDIERSAKNWIDLGNLMGQLGIRFHSMYVARATGEQHYFTAPLADIDRIHNLIYRSLSSLHRPSRYITMTTSAGKISILGTATVHGEKVFVLKFNEGRNMEWMDPVFLAKYDEKTNRVDHLLPYDTEEFFFAQELREIERKLMEIHGIEAETSV